MKSVVSRELLGRLVRQAWVQWAREQPGPKPSWLLPWEELDAGQREVDMRIGVALFEWGRSLAWEKAERGAPSYHDLHITTAEIPRTSIFNLPYGYEVHCSRTAGWQLWNMNDGYERARLIAGEYAGRDKWLVLDVGGIVIVGPGDRAREEEDD